MSELRNDIPQVMLDLAREAMSLGLPKVSIGFMGMDAEFVSPIEWGLWLAKRESGAGELRSYLGPITMARGEELPRVYIAGKSGDWQDYSYWGPEEIRAWMREPLPQEGEFLLPWKPVLHGERQEKLLTQWPLFESGVRHGWTMERRMDWDAETRFRAHMAKLGEVLPESLPSMTLSWDVVNNFYNVEGHPSHRSTGAPVSVGGFSLLQPNGVEEFYRNSGSHPAKLTREQVEKLLGTTAPWFVRVAALDEETEEWLHYPEALKPVEETVKE